MGIFINFFLNTILLLKKNSEFFIKVSFLIKLIVYIDKLDF